MRYETRVNGRPVIIDLPGLRVDGARSRTPDDDTLVAMPLGEFRQLVAKLLNTPVAVTYRDAGRSVKRVERNAEGVVERIVEEREPWPAPEVHGP